MTYAPATAEDLHRSQIETFVDYLDDPWDSSEAWVNGTFTVSDVRYQIEAMRELDELHTENDDPVYDWRTVTPEELFEALMNR